MPLQQLLNHDAYSTRPSDLLPDDDTDADQQWMVYCAEASKLDRTHILQVVLSDLDAEDSPLYAFIDSAMDTPHEPGRARESITILAQIGQAILDRVASAVDDGVNLRMAIGGGR